jgi:hypothetical protein
MLDTHVASSNVQQALAMKHGPIVASIGNEILTPTEFSALK